jgi:hypothetical protein
MAQGRGGITAYGSPGRRALEVPWTDPFDALKLEDPTTV